MIMRTLALSNLAVVEARVTVNAENAGAGARVDDSDPAKQICSCNAVSRGDRDLHPGHGQETTYAEIKKCTKAGSGLRRHEPDVKKILKASSRRWGHGNNNLCAHFDTAAGARGEDSLDEQNFKSSMKCCRARPRHAADLQAGRRGFYLASCTTRRSWR